MNEELVDWHRKKAMEREMDLTNKRLKRLFKLYLVVMLLGLISLIIFWEVIG